MKIENLKPGDKVKLFKIETLIKKGLVRKYLYRYIDTQNTTMINPHILCLWNVPVFIEHININEKIVECALIKGGVARIYKPEWVRCRVK